MIRSLENLSSGENRAANPCIVSVMSYASNLRHQAIYARVRYISHPFNRISDDTSICSNSCNVPGWADSVGASVGVSFCYTDNTRHFSDLQPAVHSNLPPTPGRMVKEHLTGLWRPLSPRSVTVSTKLTPWNRTKSSGTLFASPTPPKTRPITTECELSKCYVLHKSQIPL
jgi:hypothetical protein